MAERVPVPASQDSKSGIRKGKSWVLGAAALITGMALMAAPKATTPTPTPTPRPRLTGGFGRAAATPIVSETNGQALSDVVRAASEAKTRKEPKPPKPSVAITNDNLVTDSKKGRLTTTAPRNVPPTPAGKPAAGATATAAAPPAVLSVGSEVEWRERARVARRQVEEGKARVYQLEGDAAALEKDFYRWDDGQYRDGVIKPAWEKKKQELEAARKELAAAEKELADLPELARKAGALPGWIRE
jgi:hypothetical protein